MSIAASLARHDDVIAGIAGINKQLEAQDERLERVDARTARLEEKTDRIEALGATTAEQVTKTNGRLTSLEKAFERFVGKLEGISIGAGGAGRLLFMLLSATSLVVGLVLAIVNAR